MSKLLVISTRDRFTLNYQGQRIADFYILEPKFAPIQIMENIRRAKQIERELEAGNYPDLALQAKFNALTKIN